MGRQGSFSPPLCDTLAVLSPADQTLLKANLERIHERIGAACTRAGRATEDVSLVAVTKYAGAGYARALAGLGQVDLGENRVDHLLTLAKGLKGNGVPAARWHVIGHLQRNKASRAARVMHVLHSLDSLQLAMRLNDQLLGGDLLDVYIQIRLSNAKGRSGISADDLSPFVQALSALTRLRVVGLMGMPPLGRPEGARALYAGLRQLAQETPGLHGVHGLSMGMTSDLEVAVEEGATVVRVGRALLDGLSDEALGA